MLCSGRGLQIDCKQHVSKHSRTANGNQSFKTINALFTLKILLLKHVKIDNTCLLSDIEEHDGGSGPAGEKVYK